MIRLRASLSGLSTAATGVTALGIGFDARPAERYLGFGERSNAVDQRGQRGRELRRRRALPARRAAARSPRFVPPWGFQPRDDATYYPVPWLLSTAGYGVLVDNTETQLLPARQRRERLSVEAAPGAPRPAAPPRALSLRFFAGPRPGRRAAPASPPRPAASPRRRRPGASAPGSSRRPDDEQPTRSTRCRRADAPGLGRARPTRTTCPAAPSAGGEAEQRARTRPVPRARAGDHHLLQPDDLHRLRRAPTTRRPQRGALTATAAGDALRLPLHRHRRPVPRSAQFDFSSAAGRARCYGELLARGGRRRLRRLDGGLRRVHAARLALGRTACAGTAMHNLYPRPLPLRRLRLRAAAPAGRSAASSRSGWTGAAPCAQIVWGGDPTVGWGFDGLALGGARNGADAWACRGSAPGAPTSAASSRSAPTSSPPSCSSRWVQFGAVSGVMRTQANGIALPAKRPPAGLRPRRQIANWRRYAKLRTQLYPYLAAADADLPAQRAADHAPPRPRLPRRPGARPRATTSSCSAPTCWPRRSSSRARASAALYLPARPLGRPLALGRLPRARRRAAAARAEAARAAAARSRSRRRSTSCRCWFAPGRSCRCCRPTSTPSPPTAVAARTSSGCASEPTASTCWRSRAAAAPRASTGTGGSPRVERRGRWTLRVRSGNRGRSYEPRSLAAGR